MIRNFPALVAAYRLDLPLAVDRSRIEPKDNSYIYRDLEFSLSRDEIVKLLMTNKLYGGPWLCVRELLQNSLDALRYRKALIKRDNGTDWEHGRVEMHHGVDEHGHEVIRCTDNGAGMDRGIVERFLTKAGRSYYRSPEFEQERASFRAACFDFDPCAQFGIGFMSSFMLGDHVVIRTRRDYGPIRGLGEPLIIEINGLGGIVVIREGGNDQEAGTTVEITGRRKPRFVDEFVDQVKLLEVIEGYALACEFPIEARCSLPELEESVTIPPRFAVPRTSLEDSEVKQYVTIEQNFSDVHPSLSGLIKASFIVDEEGHFTLNNSEARWNLGTVNKMHYVELVNADGTQIERYFPRRENQICMDGILVSGHPGRDDQEGRRRNTIGYAGPHIEMGRAVYILDIRGDIKPQLTPARTVPEDRSAFREISPRWGYISLLSNKAHGRLWERVAEQLEHGLSPQTFWQLAVIYSEHTTNIVWMRAGAIWSLVSLPILYDDGRHEWKSFSSLGVLKPISSGEETTKRGEKHFSQLVSTDGWQIGPYDQLTEWRASNQDRVDWDLRYIAASMSTVVIEGGEAKLEFRAPSQPDMPPWEFVFSDSFSLILALPYSGEIKDYCSVHLPCRNINRYHPLVSEALRAKYLEQPSALQEFASRAVYFLSDPAAIAILNDSAKPVTRWHKYVASKFMDVDWQAVSPELHPPYKILLEDGRTVLVSAEDFERWANATEYKR